MQVVHSLPSASTTCVNKRPAIAKEICSLEIKCEPSTVSNQCVKTFTPTRFLLAASVIVVFSFISIVNASEISRETSRDEQCHLCMCRSGHDTNFSTSDANVFPPLNAGDCSLAMPQPGLSHHTQCPTILNLTIPSKTKVLFVKDLGAWSCLLLRSSHV